VSYAIYRIEDTWIFGLHHGALPIAAPWIFDFDRGGAETWVPVILGIAMIGLALMTDYELSASRQVSMRTHLMIDLISGALLAVSPWLFGFADYVWEPHLILGILEMGAALMTKRSPSNERAHHRHTIGAH
jgi:hypothetical protein